MNASLNVSEIGQRLVRWHQEHQRALPWRQEPAGRRDDYAVWVSEIMAQQTRLDTVVDYYRRWMDRFPTLEALAAADQQEVLKLWEGLGYYARARNLHRAARQVLQEHGGRVPDRRTALLQLPGIGPYTAGAILSLAYGQREPILDGNVKRVLSRLADVDTPIEQQETLRRLWQLAQAVVEAAPEGEAGTVNEALMELGATVCTPTSPRCLLCPLADLCQAAARGTQAERPVTSPRRPTPHYDVAAGIIWRGAPYRSDLLVAQRPQEGMLGGLWEFPGGKLEAGDPDLASCLQREIREELGIEIQVLSPLMQVRHAYTHFRITLHAFHARHVQGVPQALGCDDWRWIAPAELTRLPLPVTDQKIARRLLAEQDAPPGQI
ncbi:adenine glycosylase [Litorilinea aerophila]|nr:adenine glycosylase [Litorilinea aerophila]